MTVWLPLEDIADGTPVREVGGKALQLAALTREGHRVPGGGCIPANVYAEAVEADGFRERLALELNRKPFADMRWEELWDAALRIRGWFLKMSMPAALKDLLAERLHTCFGDAPVAVRSSAPSEDSARASFAGLHESFVNVRGVEEILQSVRLVWASLWSDRALLYRQELGLDVEGSAMAVVVQRFVDGRPSGVVFSQNPMDASQGVVEAVVGRGEDFVEGTRAPDRWLLERDTGRILTREKSAEHEALCLSDERVGEVFGIARALERRREVPQDVEWTLKKDELYVLQSRAITTPAAVEPHGDDKRPWYLTLRRSLPQLRTLHRVITKEMLPGMEADADRFGSENLVGLSDDELVDAYKERQQTVKRWLDAYWESCIPFAHGMRLFGEVYNDRMRPEDPHEFMRLLSGESLISLERDARLRDLGVRLARRPKVDGATPTAILKEAEAWLRAYAPQLLTKQDLDAARQGVLDMAARLAEAGERRGRDGDEAEEMKARFLATFSPEERCLGEELLEIGQASYALRDNDNHYLDRVQAEADRAYAELRRRAAAGRRFPASLVQEDADPAATGAGATDASSQAEADARLRGKQLVGQPSSPGMATGRARVVTNDEDVLAVERGEVLVCDAISPTMTFAAPLVAAIVERRGGMLIHGAIIAREYGIPCVTGVAQATELIRTGQTVSVDGHLGLVSVRVEEG